MREEGGRVEGREREVGMWSEGGGEEGEGNPFL